MNMPETANANHHYAFKKGYRMAMDGKPMSHMPSSIKRDADMRAYFQKGWDQLHEEMAAGNKIEAKPPWRNRFAWFLMMLLAGIGTASLMINQINETKTEQQHHIDQSLFKADEAPSTESNPVSLKASPSEKVTPKQLPETTSDKIAFIDESLSLIEADTTISEDKTSRSLKLDAEAIPPENQLISAAHTESKQEENTLALLSNQQRKDLEASQQEKQLSGKTYQLEKIQPSSIEMKVAEFTSGITNHEPTDTLSQVVPKYIRKLYFFTQVANAKNQTIYHRWIYQNRVMATVPLNISSPLYRTWSSKRLTSAWKGQWYVEVLDQQKHVIDRYSFRYVE